MVKRFLLISLIFLISVFIQPVSAQDSTPSPDDVLFHDDFEGSIAFQGWGVDRQSASIVLEGSNRALRLASDDWAGININDADLWTDYALELRVKILQSTSGGTPDLFFNTRSTEGNNYTGWVNTSYAVLGISGTVNGTPASFGISMPAPVRLDFWHTFRFQNFGSQIRLYLDGELVGELENDEITHGGVNINIAPGAEVYIDDVWVLNRDVPSGIPSVEYVFAFDDTQSTCDFANISASSDTPLTGVMLREVNVREAPSISANAVSFLSAGETVTITDANLVGEEASMQIEGSVRYSTIWLQVTFERDGTERSGYVWGGAVRANVPETSFSNPYNDCFPETDTTGWTEALTAEIGANWESFINCNAFYYATCGVYVVLDGEWIDAPMPLRDSNGELLGIVHLSMRGYYLDARGEIQSVIMPIYVQMDGNEAYVLQGGQLVPSANALGFVPPTTILDQLSEQYPDLRGRVSCVSFANDYEGLMQQYSVNESDLTLRAPIEAYYGAHQAELVRFAATGDPRLGILFTGDGGGLGGCYVDRDGDALVALPTP